MCGIVGLLVRDQGLEQDLGRYFTTMLEEMTARGPDSAGLAIYDRDVAVKQLNKVDASASAALVPAQRCAHD